MFWICDGSSADNPQVFQLLLSCADTASRPFLLFILPCQWGSWGWARIWERTQPGQLTPTDQRNIPYDVVLCSIINTGTEEVCQDWHCLGQTEHLSAGGEQLDFFAPLAYIVRFWILGWLPGLNHSIGQSYFSQCDAEILSSRCLLMHFRALGSGCPNFG